MKLKIPLMLLLVCFALTEGGALALQPPTGTSLHAERINWISPFLQESQIGSAYLTLAPLALSSRPTTRIVLRTYVTVGNITHAQLWVAQPSGKSPKKLFDEAGCRILQARWSPDGKQLALVTAPFRDEQQSSQAILHLIETETGKKTVVADSGAQLPQWNSEGRVLFYWRLVTAASQVPGQSILDQWRAYQVNVKTKPFAKVAVSQTLFEQPGAFSPTGQFIAGVIEDKLVVEDTARHKQQEFDIPPYGQLDTTQWSADAQWFYVRARVAVHDVTYKNFAIQIKEGKIVNLDALPGLVSPQTGQKEFVTGGWMPGTGNRLFLKAQSQVYSGHKEGAEAKEPKWMVYNLDRATLESLEGLAALSQVSGGAEMEWSEDGQFLRLGNSEKSLFFVSQ